MAKKIVELSTKRKVELKEMSIDDIDFCNDITILKQDEQGKSFISGISISGVIFSSGKVTSTLGPSVGKSIILSSSFCIVVSYVYWFNIHARYLRDYL